MIIKKDGVDTPKKNMKKMGLREKENGNIPFHENTCWLHTILPCNVNRMIIIIYLTYRSKKMIGIDDRRRLGSMVKMDEYAKMVADEDEADVLESRDMEDMAVHRMDRMGAYARPKISKDADMVRVRR